ADRFAKRNNLQHFCWLLGQDAKPGNRYVKLVKSTGDSLIALSDFIVKEFHKNYAITPAHVITPGIDPSLFNVIQPGKDIDILGAGSLIPLKQFSVLIELVRFLREDFPDIKVVICGNGPEWELLNKAVKENHLENNIELTGSLSHHIVLALMQRTKIFVHPSAYEGFGMVCLEALYAGAQVVSFVRPMNVEIKNWHFAQAQGDMLNVVKSLLESPAKNHLRVAPYMIADINKAMMKLFDYNEAITS
ncbi:MAG TPA: glycosyltransferase, partial [Mucilaginibacter sp.]